MDGEATALTVLPEDCCLAFGMAAQAVLSLLGPPEEVFDGPRGGAHELLGATHRHCVHNYFSRGLDIVFEAFEHTVIGFVLHTNFAGQQDFGVYNRCCFEVCVGELGAEPEPELGGGKLFVESSREEFVSVLGVPVRGTAAEPAAVLRLAAGVAEDPLGTIEVDCWPACGLVVETATGAGGAGGAVTTLTCVRPTL